MNLPQPRPRKEWVLTRETFDRFLAILDNDRDKAGEKYEEIRLKLLKYFQWCGSSFPDLDADETINRVMRRMEEGANVYNLNGYIYGVARLHTQSDKPRQQNRARHAQRTTKLPIQTNVNREETEADVAGVAGRMLGADNRIPRDFVFYQVLNSEQIINRSDSTVGPTGGRKDQAGVTLDGVDVINTQNATLGNTVASKNITELPRNARNLESLLTLQPDLSLKSSTSSLEPRTTKSENRTTITLASSIKSITLKLRLDVARPHREYRAVIETVNGRPITTLSWSTFDLNNIVDTPSLPTADLPSDDYVLVLTGKISNGSFIRVAEFSFRVVKN